MRKKKLTIDDRLEQHRRHIKKLNSILRTLKDIQREGSMVEKEIEILHEKLRDARELLKAKIKEKELEDKIRRSA